MIKLGNIRQTNIKNITAELLEKYHEQFKTGDFQHNKTKVQELTDVKSKLLRNRIAGYITRRLSTNKDGGTISNYDEE